MKKHLLLLHICIMAGLAAAWAQGPNGSSDYYKTANGKKGAALKTALFTIIKDPSVVSYNGLLNAYIKTDKRADGYLRDWYSNVTKYVPGSACGNYSKEGDAYNREHCIPQSWFKKDADIRCDIVHVIPTDGYVNNRRSDNPFGEVSNPTYQSANQYSKLGPSKTPGYTGTVFEPNDKIKGDIARIYFYMATCYEDVILTWTAGTGEKVIDANSGSKLQPYKQWVFDMMLRWAQLDPIDDVEIARNNACYEVQRNRNPFVDYPGLENYIWGDKKDKAFSYDNYEEATSPDDPTPVDPTPDDPDPDDPLVAESTDITLNNTFFGCDWNGARPSGGAIKLTGKQDGITVIYSKGDSGQNMYCNSTQIRLYKYNTLTFSVSSGDMTAIKFDAETDGTGKELYATTGTVDGFTWAGKTKEVQFYTDENKGNIRLKNASVTIDSGIMTPTGIDEMATYRHDGQFYDLQGRRVNGCPNKGLYILNGKKVMVR